MLPLAFLLVGLACVGMLAYGGTLAARVVSAMVDRQLLIAERRVALEERRVVLEEQSRKPKAPTPPMPQDLRNRIAAFDEEWARDAEERTLHVLYAELDDWEKVRHAVRPLPGPESIASTDQIFAPVPEFPR